MPERYGSPRPPAGSGARVLGVTPRSDAAWAGLRAGDTVLAVDGEGLLDILDWRWRTAEPSCVLTVLRDGERLDLPMRRRPGRPAGVRFADVVFDGVRECANACRFCFVRQLPAGLRASLYVRDDDYRLSFLSGTFVTLTDLSDADLARIIALRLSPLYVSVHATDPEVRRELIRPPRPDRTLERLEALLAAGIEVHTQIVLVPGVNDGAVLDATLDRLSAFGAASVGIVPLGYTAHQRRFERSFEDPGAAAAVIDQVGAWRQRAGRPPAWVQLADELFLAAGRPLPSAEAYGALPHFENGIGMVRVFFDELAAAARGRRPRGHAVAVSGELFAPVLHDALRAEGLADAVEVLGVPSRLLGGGVSVTGLLDGAAVIDAIRAHPSQGPFLVPDVVVNSDGLLLDDVPAAELARRCGKQVRMIGSRAGDLVDAVCGPRRLRRR